MPSTVVAHISYTPDQYRLRVKFTSGLSYDYLGVPPDIYEEFKQSKIKGVYLNKYIKNKYEFVKNENETE